MGIRSEPPTRRGFTILEVVVSLPILIVIFLTLGQYFVHASRTFSDLTQRAFLSARAQVVLDRIVEELLDARFASLDPAAPLDSSHLRFERIIAAPGGVPIYGNPFQIDVDENDRIRLWEDIIPLGGEPQLLDVVSFVESKVDTDGLRFTRQGSLVYIDLRLAQPRPNGATIVVEFGSAVKLRNFD